MKRADLAAIYLISFTVILAVGLLEKSAGYMDAQYYAATGRELLRGHGFTQYFLWNYLDDPAGIPHPSNTYWMPLASILSAFNIILPNAGRPTNVWIINILISALTPVFSASAAFGFTKRRSDGWMAAGLAVFSGFYLLYYALPETFTAEMILGFLIISLLNVLFHPPDNSFRQVLLWGVVGLLTGLLHMARAEGLLWFGISLGFLVVTGLKRERPARLLLSVGGLILGYLIIAGAWYGRNLVIWNQLFPPGANLTLWITHYDQTFSFPASRISFGKWFESGLIAIMGVRLEALWMNLKSAIAVQGGILLTPFIIAGLWIQRRDIRIVLAGIYYILVFFIMTFVFPFAGSRGGFIHSAAGVQILFWAVVPIGLDRFLRWGEEKRGWNQENARRVFQIGILSIMAVLTGIILFQRVLQKTDGVPAWTAEERKYQEIMDALVIKGMAPRNEPVMIKNPPGWNLVTGLPAIVIPNGDPQTVLSAAERYGASILILDRDHPKFLDDFYRGAVGPLEFQELFTIRDAKIYLIKRAGGS